MDLRDAFGLVNPLPERGAEADPLAGCITIDDLRRRAKKRLPKPVFDYIDGGADDETTMRANRAALDAYQFQPRVLVDVGDAGIGTTFLGQSLPAPLLLSPTGYQLMAHPDGEIAAARAAAAVRLPYGVSNVATTAIEDVCAAAAEVDKAADVWTQLYLNRDHDVSWAYLERAWGAGSRVLLVAVDTNVSGNRVRDRRNGLAIPPKLRAGAVARIAGKPGYWSGVLRGPAYGFPNMPGYSSDVSVARMGGMFDPGLSWDTLPEIRAHWPGTILLKGPVGPEDARRAIDAGIDGLHLSNHGGRQLDRCIPPLRTLPAVRAAVGEQVPIIVDSGFRSGSDVAIGIALGADLVALGRAYVYGLGAAGQLGVTKAIEIVRDELRRTLQLLGFTSLAELRAHGSEVLVR